VRWRSNAAPNRGGRDGPALLKVEFPVTVGIDKYKEWEYPKRPASSYSPERRLRRGCGVEKPAEREPEHLEYGWTSEKTKNCAPKSTTQEAVNIPYPHEEGLSNEIT